MRLADLEDAFVHLERRFERLRDQLSGRKGGRPVAEPEPQADPVPSETEAELPDEHALGARFRFGKG